MFLLESFKEGGWGMYPILILAAITIFIAIDRFLYVSKSKVDVDKLMSLLKSQHTLDGKKVAVLAEAADSSPVDAVVKPALSAMDHPVYDIWVVDCSTASGSSAKPG